MPWEIKEEEGEFSVYKRGGGKVRGGTHASREQAQSHMSALYSNMPDHSTVKSLGESVLASIFGRRSPDIQADNVSLVTIKDVPILSTGIEYPLATGPTTFTEEDLIDAVLASKDPHILPPRLKIGHTNPAAWVEAGGEPAFGKANNLRLGDNNQTIYGDYTGVPEWLAEILPTAYPNRSIEGNWSVETVGGNKYRLVINAVALLGVKMPAITCLEDLKDAYGGQMPEGVQVAAESSEITAAVNVEDVRRAYYEELKAADDPTYDFWWVRAMQLNPNELIVDDGEGGLYRVPFAVRGDNVKFQDAVAVKIQYTDLPASKQAKTAAASSFVAGMEAMAAAARREVTTFASRESSGRINATQEGADTLDYKAVAKQLGMPDDATEEQVKSKLAELGAAEVARQTAEEQSGQSGTGTPDEGPEGHTGPSPEPNRPQPPQSAGIGGPKTTPPAEAHPDNDPFKEPEVEAGVVKLDVNTYKRLAAGAQLAETIAAEQAKDKSEALVGKAIEAGKIPPASKEQYLKIMKADPEGTTKLLAELQPGLVPVREMGSGGGNGEQNIEGEALPDDWFPGIQAKRETAQKGWRRVTQAQEA